MEESKKEVTITEGPDTKSGINCKFVVRVAGEPFGWCRTRAAAEKIKSEIEKRQAAMVTVSKSEMKRVAVMADAKEDENGK